MSALSQGLFLPDQYKSSDKKTKYVSVPPKCVLNAEVGIRNLTTAADENVADHEFMNLNYCQVKLGNCLNL